VRHVGVRRRPIGRGPQVLEIGLGNQLPEPRGRRGIDLDEIELVVGLCDRIGPRSAVSPSRALRIIRFVPPCPTMRIAPALCWPLIALTVARTRSKN